MASTSKSMRKREAASEFPTNWNIDAYRTEYESEEHWLLRRRFMEEHKDKFPEDRLVCLAQVFINMEFMGCKYPAETMRLVGELSKDLAKDFRASRENKLKRTFVTASDAAEARAKGRRKTQQEPSTSSPKSIRQNPSIFQGLPYGKFTVYLHGGRQCLQNSAQRSKCSYEERDLEPGGLHKNIGIFIDGKMVENASNAALKVAKSEVFTKALKVLQLKCFTIQPRADADRIHIEKSNNKVVCEVIKSQIGIEVEAKLDGNNKGYKMMKMMGWTGGGLGANKQGREDPVGYLLKQNRQGLGADVKLDRNYFMQMLNNYVSSDDIRDLQFDETFTKEERAILHEIANRYDLKSHSTGSNESRRLNITKKNITNERILTEVLINKNPAFCNKYAVQVPQSKAHIYTEHTAELVLDIKLPTTN